MKRIMCRDLIPGCTFTAHGRSDAEVLSAELEHVRETHGLSITPQFLERARDRIADDRGEASTEVTPRAARRG